MEGEFQENPKETSRKRNGTRIEDADYDIYYTYEEMKKLWTNSPDEYETIQD
jgi:hypothetical protein